MERLLACWEEPIEGRADPEADFGALYHDPVTVNGVATPVADLVRRARALQKALEGRRTRIVHCVEAGRAIVVGFTLTGRHVGPFPSALGMVPATGVEITVRATDILTMVDGRVKDIWVISDDLAVLTQMNAVQLTV
ncbi:hypothetical protein GCM10009681_11460 [Luedemannella helvata]|uniref:SnoaL-like polyketide cyclase n=1 Tax=Luedemannella helvata TaxID=349315 RepID=A0ABP4W499_9ACTN